MKSKTIPLLIQCKLCKGMFLNLIIIFLQIILPAETERKQPYSMSDPHDKHQPIIIPIGVIIANSPIILAAYIAFIFFF